MWTKEQMWTRRDQVLVKQVGLTAVYLLFLFLGILSYFYGSLFHSSDRASNLKILAVDYDGSEIGQALRTAYNRLQKPDFVSLEYQPASAFPDISTLGSSAICSRGYWGVIYTHPGATDRLRATISSGNTNTPYNSSDTITLIYSGVHYPVISQAYIGAELQALVAATTSTFHTLYGRNLFRSVNEDNAAAVSALLEPIRATSIVFSPAEQGTRVLLNTITLVAPPLMQFFFVMALDHISVAVTVFSRWPKHRVYFTRLVGSKIFSFFGALVVAGCIYAFRESWNITGAQFVETWLCFWFYMDISYVVMDSVIGTVVPLRFVPFFVFTWVIVSVTSTLFPFELSPGFYRWGYVMPAHNVWLLLMQIWSDGCISKLHIALPVLFAWWLVGHITSAATVWRKCTTARKTADSTHPTGDSTPHQSKSVASVDSGKDDLKVDEKPSIQSTANEKPSDG